MTVLRTALFHGYFGLMSAIMCIGFTPALLGPRRWVAWGIGSWGALTLWGLRVICGLTYEVRGREHIAPGACLYAGKHLAMWDTVVIPVILKDPALVLKKQLLRVPYYGWYASKAGMIALDRNAHAKALRSLVAQAKDRLARGRPIVIFPEGTRKDIGAAPDYKPGVAALYGQLGVACVPFALNSGRYWKGSARRPGRIVIEFLPPIAPGLRRGPFMEALQTGIETATARLVAEAPQ